MAEQSARKRVRQRVDGILLLDKPHGWSSNAALQRARHLLDAAKAGHAGTLDPLATGLLPLCFGEATKFSQVLLDARKRYRATIRFGAATATGDAEGAVIAQAPVAFDRNALLAAAASLVGRIAQVPPAYAALKRDGRAYYDYARAGIAIERTARQVDIHAFELIDWSPPNAVFDIECSKGTYVRVLAEDLALALGSRAHLAGLRRTGSAGFDLEQAIGLDVLEALPPQERLQRLLPVDAALEPFAAAHLTAEAARALQHGQRPRTDVPPGHYRAYGPAGFIGMVESSRGILVAVRLAGSTAAVPGGTGGAVSDQVRASPDDPPK